MAKSKKYIKRSADGRFFLFIEKSDYSIDPENKTKLWISSSYLFDESVKENKQEAMRTLDNLISWNEENENFENCSKLLELRQRI